MNIQRKTNSNIESTIYQKLDLYWIFCSLFMKIVLTGMVSWLISYIKIICHHKEQIKYHPKISLGPPFYDIVNSTMSFAKHQKAEEEIRRRGGKSKTEGKSQRLCCTSLKFDLPLFWKA